MKIKYPDYNLSLLNLVSSVLVHFGVTTHHKTLPAFDSLLSTQYKNVVIMLFDGLGTAILEKHLPFDAFLCHHLHSTISSVFPPTTTSATTTMGTGLSPIEHGWLGWSLYFNEIDANVNIFPNTLSGSGGRSAADYHVAQRYIPFESIWNKISKDSNSVVKAYSVSPFSSFKSKSIYEICNTVKRLCTENRRKYIYTYWDQPDYDMHLYGTSDEQVKAQVWYINEAVELLCEELYDTLVIVTADHGLVDTKWRYLIDYPDITECLLRVPSIEARAYSFFIKPGMKDRFVTAFNRHFGDCYLLFSKEQILQNKLFGDGIPNPRSIGFIGDYLGVATGSYSIDYAPSADHDVFKAAHAGLTDEEMNVPFIVVECR